MEPPARCPGPRTMAGPLTSAPPGGRGPVDPADVLPVFPSFGQHDDRWFTLFCEGPLPRCTRRRQDVGPSPIRRSGLASSAELCAFAYLFWHQLGPRGSCKLRLHIRILVMRPCDVPDFRCGDQEISILTFTVYVAEKKFNQPRRWYPKSRIEDAIGAIDRLEKKP